MDKLSKENKRSMKRFELKEKIDFIVYLQEIIGRAYKCIIKEKRYLEELFTYINTRIDENPNKSNKEIIVNEEIYSRFLDSLSNCQCYVLNLIGYHQEVSISYKKFRDIISKGKKEAYWNL